jgi:hypothetical protein
MSAEMTEESKQAPKMAKAAAAAAAAAAASEGKVYVDYSHITNDDKDLTDLLSKADAEGVKGTDQVCMLSQTIYDFFQQVCCPFFTQYHPQPFLDAKLRTFSV